MRARGRRDRGSTSLYAVIVAIAFVAIVGLVIDGSGRLHALQRADDIAREAARVAGQQIDLNDATGAVSLNFSAAYWAAVDYMFAHGCDGASVIVEGDVITASCGLRYHPVILPGWQQATGRGSAVAQRVP
ncbi:MAG: hypothetical protein LBR33_12830 [Propionibacteriaceae bacterium]|jgi:Flp pilus assembly protein TadG|nr:hypothetical protein [Propionibacteriaceae bacterium]